MKNRYQINDDGSASIFLPRKVGADLVMLIDAADLALIFDVPGTIYSHWHKSSQTYYAQFHRTENWKQRTFWFHRFLLNASDGLVDHRNHNGLDNRRTNLRVVTKTQNNLNRRGPSAVNKTSGIRGVHLHRKTGLWRAQIRFCGKLLSLGLFQTPEGAKAAFDAKLHDLDPTLCV